MARSPTRGTKKRGASPSRREEILDAAARLIAEHGYHKTSMDSIAAAVGIHKASLYHHFESKEAIVVALHQAIIDRLFELHKARAARRVQPSPGRQLFELMMDSVSLADTHHGQLRILWDRYRELPEAMHQQVSDTRKAYRDLIIKVLRQGVATGEFADIDVEFAARAVMSLCDWAMEWYQPAGELDIEAVTERIWVLLVGGLGSGGTRSLRSPLAQHGL
jgi:TetR/AcrR family transcriptional regulator, cholesterol catabolism regulator